VTFIAADSTGGLGSQRRRRCVAESGGIEGIKAAPAAPRPGSRAGLCVEDARPAQAGPISPEARRPMRLTCHAVWCAARAVNLAPDCLARARRLKAAFTGVAARWLANLDPAAAPHGSWRLRGWRGESGRQGMATQIGNPGPVGQASMIIKWTAAYEAHGVWLAGGPGFAVWWTHSGRVMTFLDGGHTLAPRGGQGRPALPAGGSSDGRTRRG